MREVLEKGLFDEYEKCLQDEPAATTALCPVHIDVPEFCAELAKGNFRQAYAILQKRIPFTGMFCLACDAPCEHVCVRSSLDEPVRIGELERAAVRYGRVPFKKKFKVSKLKGKVAVVGGGISGLAAAFDLDRRGFAVTLFEQSNRLGGWLWEFVGDRLEAEDILQECEAISELAIEVRYGQLIDTTRLAQLLAEYDAVFLATGVWSEPIAVDPVTFRVGSSNLFAGGALAHTGDSVIYAVSSGKRAAITMERLITKTSLTAERDREGSYETRLPISLEYVEATTAPVKQGVYYTPEEAMQEATRCLGCTCDECVKACAHIRRYGRKPKTYAREIYTNENVFLGTRYANKMINSCTLCGLCGQRCHLGISMAPLVSQTRRSMVENKKMPPSAHDFALRDMAFANSEHCACVRQPPVSLCTKGREADNSEGDENAHNRSSKAPYLFFPGCQLAASEPAHVEAAYAWLLKSVPHGVALALGCCGAPADWAGRDDLLQESLATLHAIWEDEGKPTFILACSSCKDVFTRYLPDITVTTLWSLLDEKGLPENAPRIENTVVSVHDACSTRHDDSLHENIRTILKGLGYQIEELRYHGRDTKCCGFGGLVYYAHREQETDFAVDRARETPNDLVVYCAMCKDLFVDAGTRCFHILDLLFAEDVEEQAPRSILTISQRQENRARLKRRMLRDFWGEEEPAPAPKLPGYTVVIPPHVTQAMEERLILVSDVEDALARALADRDECFYHAKDDCYLINIRKQYVTYWVWFRLTESFESLPPEPLSHTDQKTLEVLSAYSHRMEIVRSTE